MTCRRVAFAKEGAAVAIAYYSGEVLAPAGGETLPG
jgi:hypothetical protein